MQNNMFKKGLVIGITCLMFVAFSSSIINQVGAADIYYDAAFTDVSVSDDEDGTDVAITSYEIIDIHNLQVSITNAYPGYSAYVDVTITNIGDDPIVLEDLSIEPYDTNALLVELNGISPGTSLFPTYSIVGHLTFEIQQVAPQCSTYPFEIIIIFSSGSWFDSLIIGGVIHTGSLTLAYDDYELPECQEFHIDPDTGQKVPGEWLGKDVATCTAKYENYIEDILTLKSGQKTLCIFIDNAYPQYIAHTTARLHNIGTIPINICKIFIFGVLRDPYVGVIIYDLLWYDPDEDNVGEFWEDINCNGIVDAAVDKLVINMEITYELPRQIDPCNNDPFEIKISFTQDAREDHTYELYIGLHGIVWNADYLEGGWFQIVYIEGSLYIGESENQPPTAVTNLAVSESTYNSVTLTWTAPGDDNDEKKVSGYDIRYSTALITEDNWESAVKCNGELEIELGGERQFFTVDGLEPITNYYFGIKSIDELQQESKLSNIVDTMTFPERETKVPYVHQIWDTSFDGFDGHYGCGPTSTIMILTYLNRLIPWGGKCIGDLVQGGWKEKDDDGNILYHYSMYGKYISKEYTYSGVTWDYLSYDKSDNEAYGAYGFIVPNDFAIALRIQRFLWEHGLRGNLTEDDSYGSYQNTEKDSPNFRCSSDFDEEYIQRELAKGHLIIASTGLGCKSADCANSYCDEGRCGGGHIVLIIGYDESTSEYIVNDPYGNRLNNDYKNSNGRYVRYDWDTLGHWVNKNPDCDPADCELVPGPSWIIITKSYKDKDNSVPPQPEDLKQCNEDGSEIAIGESSSGPAIHFKGTIRDENNPSEIFDSVRLQVMIFKKLWNIFWFPIWVDESDFITCSDPNGQEVPPIKIHGLPPGSYYWNARTVDVRGKASPWINYGNNPGENDFIIPDPDAFIYPECPVSLSVVDPDNLLINKFVNEIPGAFYNELDLDNDGELNDFIIIPNIKIGDYKINVIPDTNASPFDNYSLILKTPIKTLILADNILISNLPNEPYLVRSTGTEIFRLIPSDININPNTLNLNSTGKWITCYIELPDGYNVSNISIDTTLLNDIINAETTPINISDYDYDGIPDLMVKFDRQEVIDILEPGDEIEITVAGELVDGTKFEGVDYIKVI